MLSGEEAGTRPGHPGEYPYLAGGSLNLHQLNARHAEAIGRWWDALARAGGRPPVGLLADLAGITEGYARTAARLAVAGSLFDGEPGR